MHHFNIHIQSFHQVREFVSLAMVQPFDVLVGNDKQQINGKSFMGMMSLDYSRPVVVRADCDENAFSAFLHQAERFLTA